MAYIHPQEVTVKEYAAHRRITPRAVYEYLGKKAIPDARKVEGGWRIPLPILAPDSPYLGQLVTFGDGSVGEITIIVRDASGGIQITAIVRP